jgi:hypothetical protein
MPKTFIAKLQTEKPSSCSTCLIFS